jgi:hypothetical protein
MQISRRRTLSCRRAAGQFGIVPVNHLEITA